MGSAEAGVITRMACTQVGAGNSTCNMFGQAALLLGLPMLAMCLEMPRVISAGETLQNAYKNNAFHAAFTLHYICQKKSWERKAVMADPIEPVTIRILGIFLRGIS